MMRRQYHRDQQSRVFYELSSLVLGLLRSPPSPISFSDHHPVMPPAVSTSNLPSSPPSAAQISPAGFASLLLGISLALMLCGSVTFFIGFMLMPWVIGLVMVFYLVGIVSYLSMLGRAILCHATAPASPRKDIPGFYVRESKQLRNRVLHVREVENPKNGQPNEHTAAAAEKCRNQTCNRLRREDVIDYAGKSDAAEKPRRNRLRADVIDYRPVIDYTSQFCPKPNFNT